MGSRFRALDSNPMALPPSIASNLPIAGRVAFGPARRLEGLYDRLAAGLVHLHRPRHFGERKLRHQIHPEEEPGAG
jgi:hypothetical protein